MMDTAQGSHKPGVSVMDNSPEAAQERPSMFRPLRMQYLTSYYADGGYVIVGFDSRDESIRFERHIERVIAAAKAQTEKDICAAIDKATQ